MKWDELIMLPLNAVRELFGRPPVSLYIYEEQDSTTHDDTEQE